MKTQPGVPHVMNAERAARVRDWIESVFPERHLYVRSHGVVRGWILTPRQQIGAALAGLLAGVWLAVSTGSMILDAMAVSAAERKIAQTTAKYERYVAELRARHDSALAHLEETAGSIDELAATVERRHAALATVMTSSATCRAPARRWLPPNRSAPTVVLWSGCWPSAWIRNA